MKPPIRLYARAYFRRIYLCLHPLRSLAVQSSQPCGHPRWGLAAPDPAGTLPEWIANGLLVPACVRLFQDRGEHGGPVGAGRRLASRLFPHPRSSPGHVRAVSANMRARATLP